MLEENFGELNDLQKDFDFIEKKSKIGISSKGKFMDIEIKTSK